MFAYNILQIALYGMFGGVVSGTMESVVGLVLPWWSYSLMAMASIAVLGYRKIDLSARVLSVVVIAEYLAILTLDFAILKSGGDSGVNLDAFSSQHVFSGTPSIGLLFCFAAFIGFEATTIYGEEAKNPQRTIPIATYCSVLLIGGFYALSVWAMVVGVGADKIVPLLQSLQDPTTFIYGMSDHFVGPQPDPGDPRAVHGQYLRRAVGIPQRRRALLLRDRPRRLAAQSAGHHAPRAPEPAYGLGVAEPDRGGGSADLRGHGCRTRSCNCSPGSPTWPRCA